MKTHNSSSTPHRTGKQRFRNEQGALDLGSIMVGIIVIGLIGGIVAATIFAVIPWSQDNAAQTQLKNVAEAQAVYYASSPDGTFASYDALIRNTATSNDGHSPRFGVVTASASLVTFDSVSRPLSISLGEGNKCYVSVIQSESGKFFSVTNKHPTPTPFTRGLGSPNPDCVDGYNLELDVAESIGEDPMH